MAETEQRYFCVPGNTDVLGQPRVVDVVVDGGDGVERGLYSSATRAELQAKYPGLEVCTRDEYREQATAAARKPPVEIDQEEFDRLLNVLPPQGWTNRGGSESFKLSEYYTLDVTTICARIGDRYFQMRDRAGLRHEDIVAAVAAAGLLAQPAPERDAESAGPAP